MPGFIALMLELLAQPMHRLGQGSIITATIQVNSAI
jgi:hypothetical protein